MDTIINILSFISIMGVIFSLISDNILFFFIFGISGILIQEYWHWWTDHH